MSCHTASSRCSSPLLDAGSSIAAQKETSLSTVRPLPKACSAAACSKTRVSVATSISSCAPRSAHGDSGPSAGAVSLLLLVGRSVLPGRSINEAQRLRAGP
eukprot:scaffold103675_cov70-Phaeocystis_antarctica.AAC.2